MIERDEYGHLKDAGQWSPEVAVWLAEQENILLSDAAIHILIIVRQFYDQFGYSPATRPLIRYLHQRIGTDFTNASLMAQFNTGTVARTLAKLAGLPKPANCL